MNTEQLLARLWNDRYSVELGERDIPYRTGWNDHYTHTLRIILDLDRSGHDPADEDKHRR